MQQKNSYDLLKRTIDTVSVNIIAEAGDGREKRQLKENWRLNTNSKSATRASLLCNSCSFLTSLVGIFVRVLWNTNSKARHEQQISQFSKCYSCSKKNATKDGGNLSCGHDKRMTL